ncbi:MAG: cell division protein FtsA [Chthoniobacter sp.]|nr:cell division protein FtsA [Chthoniobacter sp.]
MSKDQLIVGLEIGTSKICAVVGEARSDGTIRILGVGHAPSRGVRKGEIVDFETAGKCIREALVDAEEKSDVLIASVYLGVTGAHIESFNNRGAINLPEERGEICAEDFEEVQASASEVSIPSQNSFLHSILQHYYVDGQAGVLNPVGLLGNKLEADFHIIHGATKRIQNSVRCVKEVGPEVREVVFNPVASAQVVLDENQKSLGALVVDMGGGTTDFVVYVDGALKQSGSLPIGGDHMTNDISLGLRIPMGRAEALKVEEGSVLLGVSPPGERIVLKDETGFAGKEIEREMLNAIVHCRARETLELLKRQIDESYLPYLGAGLMLTGGCSQLDGIDQLAEEIFGMPVHRTRARAVAGLTSAFEDPIYSTAIGLIKYAAAIQPERPASLLKRVLGRLSFLWMWMF